MTPLLLLTLPERRAVLFIIALGFINFLEWPVILSRGLNSLLPITIIARTLLLILLAVELYRPCLTRSIRSQLHWHEFRSTVHNSGTKPMVLSQVSADLRVLIIADDPLVRAGLATLLANQSSLTVVGRIAAELDLPAELDVYHPDVVVFDLGWDPTLASSPSRPGSGSACARTSLESLAELRETGLPIVALLPDETHASEAWTAGARGLLLRNTDAEKLQAALLAVFQGLVTLDPSLTAAILPTPDLRTPPQPAEALTPRELEVLQLLAEGLANKTIARRLDISDHTVKFHVNAILTKLGAQSRTDAVVRATRLV